MHRHKVLSDDATSGDMIDGGVDLQLHHYERLTLGTSDSIKDG